MQALGARSVPVVAQGKRYIWAQNVRDLAAFLGMLDRVQASLPPDALVDRWLSVLRAAQRHVRQLSPDDLRQLVIPDRDRSVRMLAFHVFRIAEGYLQAVQDGWVHNPFNLEIEHSTPGFHEPVEIADYGETVIARLAQARDQLVQARPETSIASVTGPLQIFPALERSTWHSAQHARQLQFVLERSGITPDGPLTEREIGGLPLPERLFE